MENISKYDFQNKGFKLLVLEDTPIYLVLTYRYSTSHFTLSEFAKFLSELFSSGTYEFRPIEVNNATNKYCQIILYS